MTILKLKSTEGYMFKILTELLQNNTKTACFEISQEGIKLCMVPNKKILIDIFLESKNFEEYEFKSLDKVRIGINLTHFHKMLKSVKKKDGIMFIIENTDELCIKIYPKDNTRISISRIGIQPVQNLDIECPTEYTNNTTILSNEFQKMCKDIVSINNKVQVISQGNVLKFICKAEGIYTKEILFGGEDITDQKFNEEFEIDQFSKISKLSGLGSILEISSENKLPLKFSTTVGNMGKISIYIKSFEQLREEPI